MEMPPIKGLKVVEVYDHTPLPFYSVRATEFDGSETDIFCGTQESAEALRAHLQPLVAHDVGLLQLRCVAALFGVERLAELIANAGDTAGEAGYATKSHMRGWAKHIETMVYPVAEYMRSLAQRETES